MAPGIPTMCPIAVKPIGIEQPTTIRQAPSPLEKRRVQKCLFGTPDPSDIKRLISESDWKNKMKMQEYVELEAISRRDVSDLSARSPPASASDTQRSKIEIEQEEYEKYLNSKCNNQQRKIETTPPSAIAKRRQITASSSDKDQMLITDCFKKRKTIDALSGKSGHEQSPAVSSSSPPPLAAVSHAATVASEQDQEDKQQQKQQQQQQQT